MTGDGSSTLLASSDSVAETLADLQFTVGEGPTEAAFSSGAPVLEAEFDGESSRRWPAFHPAAFELGVRAVFAFPMQVGAIRVGVLTLHAESHGMLSPDDLGDALALTAVAMASVLDHLSGSAPADDGWSGNSSGYLNVVHQATGMILVQIGSSAGEALLRLRSSAYASGRPVADVAADVVARRLSFRDDA